MEPEASKSRPPFLRGASDAVAFALGLFITFVATGRLIKVLWDGDKPVDGNLVTTLLLGLAALVWPTVESFKSPFGELKRKLDEATKEMDSKAKEVVQKIERTAEEQALPQLTDQGMPPVYTVAAEPTRGPEKIRAVEETLPPPTEDDDPQKGRFGGLAEAASKRLSATVKKAGTGWYAIRLRVEATADASPLIGPVKFFIHDSFKPDTYVVTPRGGAAKLLLHSYGCFTVGAICDDGTKLELDLSDPKLVEQPDDDFANR